MDLSKAFDTLDHNILLSKLQYYGINDTALQLFQSYLTKRSQYVELDTVKSALQTITTGVPQGSILGPLLFLIYVNDIVSASNMFTPIMYADDTTLVSILKAFGTEHMSSSETINMELEKINEWLKLNKLSLNINKTKYMIFRKEQKRVNVPIIQIDGTNLECVEHFNFLGITFDQHLNWKKHTDFVSSKIAQAIGVLNRVKQFMPPHFITPLYYHG